MISTTINKTNMLQKQTILLEVIMSNGGGVSDMCIRFKRC